MLDNLVYLQARYPEIATPHDWYMALACSVRDRMLARWVSPVRAYAAKDVKIACYLSAEFLIGPQLGNNLINLGIEASARDGDALRSARTSTRCSRSRKSRAWATAASGGWRPAISIRWPRSRCRRSATASATSSASSIRRSATAGRWR